MDHRCNMHAVVVAAVFLAALPETSSFSSSPLAALLHRRGAVGGLSPLFSSTVLRQTHVPRISVKSLGGMTSLRAANDRDLLVIGAGVLGGMLIEQHKAMYPDATIIAETRTTDKHSALKAKGATCRTVDDPPIEAQPNVVFCAAPGANPDYPGEVNKALERWSGAGKFVFTSSGGVYAEEDGQVVNEESVVSDGPRAQKLLSCEKLVLDKGGSVVRLAGLYTLDRGAHNYWCKVGTVDARPDGLIGLVSYEDAAGSALSVLSCDKSKVAGKVFLICDGKEQSREDICKAALGCQFYEDSKMPAFTKSDGPIGKRYDISRATSVLGWKPKYESFSSFCELNKDTVM